MIDSLLTLQIVNLISNTTASQYLSSDEKWLKDYQTYNVINLDTGINNENPVINAFTDSVTISTLGDLYAVGSLIDSSFASADSLGAINTQLLGEATSLNATIQPESDIENYNRQFNNIYLNTVAQDTLEMSAAQRNTLETIANLCPYEYGDCVYRARLILSLIDSVETEYADNCGSNMRLIADNNTYYRIYPNPAQNELTIEFADELTANATVIVFNACMQRIGAFTLSKGETRYSIDVRRFANGFYLIGLLSEDINHQFEKLIISR